ncbi:MAG: glycoside hydrolase family 38 C-terminal domain-containing protein [Ignisphaera sp.]
MNLADVERRVFDLIASSILRVVDVSKWVYGDREILLPFSIETEPSKIHVFKTRVDVPQTKFRWFMKFVVSGNARVRVDGENYAGVDEAHTYIPISPGAHDIELIVSPRTLFGLHGWALTFQKAFIVEVAWDAVKTGLRILELIRLIESLPQNSGVREDLQNLLFNTTAFLRLNPSLRQITLALSLLYESGLQPIYFRRGDLRQPYGDYAWLANVYGIGVLKGYLNDLPEQNIDKVLEEVNRINSELEKGLEALRKKHPKIGTIYIMGHSHIDAAWLWPKSETVEKVLRTFSTIVRLADEYELTFVQSSAQYYKWVEEIDRKLFEKIKSLVDSGKWVIVGGMWIESDTNLIDGESLARQFLYGQRYFLERFGRIAKIGWIPDSFGFSGNLPQIMRKSGIEVFITHKVMWNDTNEFPYHSFIWRGIDGTEIPVQILITSYNETMTPTSIYRYWERYRQKDAIPFTVYSYGYGDGGGGQTREMMEYIELVNKLPHIPFVKHVNEKEYIENVMRVKDSMPVWNDELYVEVHRGTYTTNIAVKNAMAEAEKALREAEILSTIAKMLFGYSIDKEKIDSLWHLLLFNQFHDIIPGSSIKEVYDDAVNDLRKVVEESYAISYSSIEGIVGRDKKEKILAVTSVVPWKFKSIVKIPKGFGVPDNVECQEDVDGYYLLVETTPMGIKSYRLGENICRGEDGVKVFEKDGIYLENEMLVVKIDERGDIESIKIKEGDVELLRESAKLVVHIDKPGRFDAWDVTSDFFMNRIEMNVIEKPKIISRGPLKACVEVSKGFENSRIIQRICLYKGLLYIVIENSISWRDKGAMVKHWFKTSTKALKAHYDIPFGVVERSTKMETSWERAKFEVPAVRWADISDGEKGLAIIAPSRHGYSAKGGDIALTVIRSPLFPNPWSDIGDYNVTYYIYPHKGDYQQAEVPKIAQEIIFGPLAKIVYGKEVEESVLSIDPPKAIISTFKLAYDGNGYILRLYNPYKDEVKIKISLGIKASQIIETDLIELSNISELGRNTSEIELKIKPFEVRTLRIIQ